MMKMNMRFFVFKADVRKTIRLVSYFKPFELLQLNSQSGNTKHWRFCGIIFKNDGYNKQNKTEKHLSITGEKT